jgi:integrase
MSDQLLDMLKRRFSERANEMNVFVNEETGKPFTRQSRPYKYLMERLCEKTAEAEGRKIPPFTFKSFRHFVATRLRDSGKASRYEIQHLLGHKRSDTTDIYLRSLAPDLKEAVAVMDTVIDMEHIDNAAPISNVVKITRG